MAEYVTRAGVPQRTSVLMDIRSNLGGSSGGRTGRAGVPQDVDVLMDIREATEGGVTPALTDEQQAAVDSGITAERVAKLDGLSEVLEWRGAVATVSALPTDAATGDVWHVNTDGGEYAWDGSAWQELGSVVDLSGKQDKLTAGDGISISGTTIAVESNRTWGGM